MKIQTISTTHIISMGSKLFPSVKYTFHSIYSNTSPSTKHKLPNIYLNTLWVGLCPHTHFTPPWPFPPVQNVMSQHNSNYSTTHIISMGSKLFPSVKYTFHSIYSNTSPSTKHNLHNNLFKHTLGGFMSTYPFYSSMAISPCPKYYVAQHNSNYSTTHIISMGSKLFPSVKYTFHSIYSNTSPSTKHNLWNNLFKHTLGGFMSTYPFYSPTTISPCPKNYIATLQTIQLHILFQWDQNYFPHQIYHFLNIFCPYTKYNLPNNLFKHTLFYVHIPMISPSLKNYVTTQFKQFNYTYYFNGIKIISFSQIYFSLNIF